MPKAKIYKSGVLRRFVTVRLSESDWAAIQKYLRDRGYNQTQYFTRITREHFESLKAIK